MVILAKKKIYVYSNKLDILILIYAKDVFVSIFKEKVFIKFKFFI